MSARLNIYSLGMKNCNPAKAYRQKLFLLSARIFRCWPGRDISRRATILAVEWYAIGLKAFLAYC